ncbi:DUF484 family protein [Paenirhodobacter populi]|uniref:DUF484 family protein n=1 Tax=Paenirhodobacter populi TaxID=2306993 RepID=A0A443JT24_9RHOB|nr:DUF484 family protein [Sinirhodobacter populi]RWR23664.1 DUF484 family protein [Sinirhodobacter populi]
MNDLALAQTLREKIIADPEVILGDHDLMRALIAANQQAMGANVIDLRGVAMERLERRLDRLEDTHRTVIAAAYENLSGTNQIHRAVLKLLEPLDFHGFMAIVSGDVADILRVDKVRLVLETTRPGDEAALTGLGDALCLAAPGFVQDYMHGGQGRPSRQVVLRRAGDQAPSVYGEAVPVGSEALMRLDLGEGRLPGMLAMGAEDPGLFKPSQGTDLLTFFADVFERAMRRWLVQA